MAFLFAFNRTNGKLNPLYRNIRFCVDIENGGAIIQYIDSKYLKNRFEIRRCYYEENDEINSTDV
ncbi:MAG: hypothetical protein IIV62_02530, partial [Anaerotignum sp.]|nr:hypothetical protein [Anaerotignum sp.]